MPRESGTATNAYASGDDRPAGPDEHRDDVPTRPDEDDPPAPTEHRDRMLSWADGPPAPTEHRDRVLSWLDEDDPPVPEEPPLRFGRPVPPEPATGRERPAGPLSIPNADTPGPDGAFPVPGAARPDGAFPAPGPDAPRPGSAFPVPGPDPAWPANALSAPNPDAARPDGGFPTTDTAGPAGALPGPRLDGAFPVPGPDAARPDGARWRVARTPVFLAVIAVVLISAALVLVGQRLSGRLDGGGADGAARTVSAPLGGLRRAEFELVSGVRKVTVRGGTAAGDLYRISTPRGGGTVPQVERRGTRIALRLVPSGRNGPDEVDILLNRRVAWDLRLTGGAAVRVVDASGFGLRGLAVSTGSTRTELSLPKPAGRVPIRLAGGVDTLSVRLPAGVHARVVIGEGAGRVVIDGRIRDGVAAGRLLGTVGWQRSKRRYDIELQAGASTVTVRREAR